MTYATQRMGMNHILCAIIVSVTRTIKRHWLVAHTVSTCPSGKRQMDIHTVYNKTVFKILFYLWLK